VWLSKLFEVDFSTLNALAQWFAKLPVDSFEVSKEFNAGFLLEGGWRKTLAGRLRRYIYTCFQAIRRKLRMAKS
jgi:hypothetical protein